jgi:hypothetical protein
MAKTVMGSYSANDMMDHLKQQGHAPPSPPAAPYRPSPSPSQPPPLAPPPPSPASASAPTAYGKPAPQMPPPQPLVPAAGANAATVFAPPPPGANPAPRPAPAGAFGVGGGPAPSGGAFGGPAPSGGAFGGGAAPSSGYGPHGHPIAPTPSHASSVPLAAPVPPQPVAPIPSAAPPYLASQTAARAGRPIEPWKDSLRMNMFIWGGVLLVAFATPLLISPKLVFNWDVIANEAGVAKLPPLIVAAVGLLSVAIAGIPMSPAPRGMIAAVLGLAGVLVPMFLFGMPPWQMLLPVAGLIILIPSLLVRNEYRDSSLPRILVTVGVITTLVPFLIPENGSLPLVELFKLAIDAPGSAKLLVLLIIAQIAIVILSLLAWMPSPASGGAKLFAWMIILSPVAILAALLVVTGMIELIPDAPGRGVSWVYGGGFAEKGIPTGFGFGVAYAVLIGYGVATVIGKKLE